MEPGVLIVFLITEAFGLAFNGITLFYILSNFDVKTHVFTLILIGKFRYEQITVVECRNSDREFKSHLFLS